MYITRTLYVDTKNLGGQENPFDVHYIVSGCVSKAVSNRVFKRIIEQIGNALGQSVRLFLRKLLASLNRRDVKANNCYKLTICPAPGTCTIEATFRPCVFTGETCR